MTTMSEEKKKRVRPTLGQVRVLEESVAALGEVIKSKDAYIHELEERLEEKEALYDELCGRASQCAVALERLQRRGFWSRLFNRQ